MVQQAPETGIDLESLFIFFDELRASGYKIDTRHYTALSDLLLALAAQGEDFRELDKLKTWIAPVICSTPVEQEDFYRRFSSWTNRFRASKPDFPMERREPLQKSRKWRWPKLRVILQNTLIALVIVAVIWLFIKTNIVGGLWQTLIKAWISIPSTVFQIGLLVAGLSGLALLYLIARLIWRFYREHQYLSRQSTTEKPELRPLPVDPFVKEILPELRFTSIARDFRRRIQVPGNIVNMVKTIEQTAVNNGWLNVVYEKRQVIPEYVVLIDCKSRLDQQARFVVEMLTHLSANLVLLHVYYFDGSPRICFAPGRQDAPLQLRDIRARHDNARLILFSSGEDFINPITGNLQGWIEDLFRWQKRALVTPAFERWGQLEDQLLTGFKVAPLTLDGLTSLIRLFEQDSATAFNTTGGHPFPEELTHRSLRWTLREPPPEPEVDEMLTSLWGYLGAEGFYWLSACAVYPELHWELTLYLGNELRRADGTNLLEVNRLVKLARLPWFRLGQMPDWLRIALIEQLSAEQEKSIRAALGNLLESAFQETLDALQLQIADLRQTEMTTRARRIFRALFKHAPKDSPLHDNVFIKFIVKKEKISLGIKLPHWLSSRFKISAENLPRVENTQFAEQNEQLDILDPRYQGKRLNKILKEIELGVNKIIGSETCISSIVLFEEKENRFALPNLVIDPWEGILRIQTREQGIGWYVLDNKKPLYIEDVFQPHYEIPEKYPELEKAGIHSTATLPLLYKEHKLGVLFVHQQQPVIFTPELRTKLETYAKWATISIEKAQRYERQHKIATSAVPLEKFFLNIAAFATKILPNSFKRAIYKIKPLGRLIRSGLNRAAPTGLVEVKVAAGDLAGYTILLDMQVDKDYWLGTYEPELQSALRELIPAGAVIYDVGANIGYVSLLLAKAAGGTGRVFAFEALPSNIEQLRRNVTLNGMEAQVTVVANAVTQAPGPVRFLVHASGGMGKAAGSAGRDDQYQSEVTVPGISLDEFVYRQGNPPPHVVKMDIEGGEMLALPGMRRVLTEARPLMLMELHGPESSRVAWETLTAAGYEICWMRPGYPAVPSVEQLGWKTYLVAKPPILGKNKASSQTAIFNDLPNRIYICYSHKDKEYLYKLQQFLANQGFDVWVDERIKTDSHWQAGNQEFIKTCDAFILLMSSNSSKSLLVQSALDYAINLKKPVYPLLLQGDKWQQFKRIQYEDVRSGVLPSSEFLVQLRNPSVGKKNVKAIKKARELDDLSLTKDTERRPDQDSILIVDNNTNWRNKLTNILAGEFNVSSAGSYNEALNIFSRQEIPFQVMITDLRLIDDNDEKDESGLKLIDEIRKRGDNIKIIVLTANPTFDAARMALKTLNVYDYLNKTSFESDNFLNIVQDATRQSQVALLHENRSLKGDNKSDNSVRDIFVIMPFDSKFSNFYKNTIKKTIEDMGWKCKRADDYFQSGTILEGIQVNIRQAKFIVADLSGGNPNVLFEVGIANATQKPVILLTRNLDDVPAIIQDNMQCFEYDVTLIGGEKLSAYLRDTAKKIEIGQSLLMFEKSISDLDDTLCLGLVPKYRSEKSDAYAEIIKYVAEKDAKLNAKRLQDITGPRSVMEKYWEYVNKARIIVADLSGRDPQTFYWSGVAYGLGKDMITLAKKGEEIPFDLRGDPRIEYSMDFDGGSDARENLKNAMELLLQRSAEPKSSEKTAREKAERDAAEKAILKPIGTSYFNLEDDHAPQMVTVILRPTGDPNRDIRRISRLHGTFISYPGKDRFAFQVFEEGRGHLIEFPNDTTHMCVELWEKIKNSVSEENLHIEPILYQ